MSKDEMPGTQTYYHPWTPEPRTVSAFERAAIDSARAFVSTMTAAQREAIGRGLAPSIPWLWVPGWSGGCFVRSTDGYHVPARDVLNMDGTIKEAAP